MLRDLVSYMRNPVLEALWRRGWEEIVDPNNPLRLADREGPRPEPWKVAAPQLVQAALAKELAIKQQNKAAQQTAMLAIENILEDWCGTPPRRHPWPFPGPPPWAFQIASELSLFANSIQAGTLRSEIETIIGSIGKVGRSAEAR